MDKFTGGNHREFTPEFKAKVALEALKERKSQKDLAEEYDIHSARIGEWRRELTEKAKDIFSSRQQKGEENTREKIEKLYQQIGELSFELEWLKKKFQGLV